MLSLIKYLIVSIIICYNFNSVLTSPTPNCTEILHADGTQSLSCLQNLKFNKAFPTKDEVEIATEPSEVPKVKRDADDEKENDDDDKDEDESNKRSNQLPFSSNIYNDNLLVMHQVNMSDCMARLHCEERCKLVAADAKFDEEDEAEMEEVPEHVRYFIDSGKIGIVLGRKGGIEECEKCQEVFPQCTELQYNYTIRTNRIYEDLLEKQLIKFDVNETHGHGPEIPEHLEFMHHSMEFLELANLTECYARVGCENTCTAVTVDPTVGQPPEKSPFLADDPYKPASVDIIHSGQLFGYNLATTKNDCNLCALNYPDCQQDSYDVARTSAMIFG